MIRLSCASLSFDGFGDEDFVHTFAKVNEAGYRHLEFNCWYPRTLTPAKMRDLAERTRVEALLIAGEAAWCPIVELELCKGARGDREIAVIRQMADILVSLDIDRDVWSTANVMARTSREHGVTVSATDVLVAACAKRHDVRLEHHDRHFSLINQTEPSQA